MNLHLPTALALALVALPSESHAQLWVENLTATNLTFAFRGIDSTDVLTTENQGAGARLSYTFNVATRTLQIDVTNLSGGWRTVGDGAAAQNVYFGAGTLMGFGFETNPDNLYATAFTAVAKSSLDAPGTHGTDWINFTLAQNYNLNGGGSANPFYMDVGTAASGNINGGTPTSGLAAGYGARFIFTFSSTSFNADTFNPADFFYNDSDADIYDMAFRFQETSGLGSCDEDKHQHHSDVFTDCSNPCQNDGSDKVALVFNTEADYQVPEPATYGLLGAASLLALTLHRRFRRR